MSRLSIEPHFEPTKAKGVGIGAWESTAIFHRAVLRPVTASAQPTAPPKALANGEIDLLALVDPQRDAEKGQWEKTSVGLSSGLPASSASPQQLISVRYTPPDEYDVEIEFSLQGGSRNAGIMFPLPHGPVEWAMGYGGGTGRKLAFGALLDGRDPNHPARGGEAFVPWPPLEDNVRYRALLEIRKGSLRALLDGKEAVRWSGDSRRLSIHPENPLRDPKAFAFFSWNTRATFYRAVVRPVAASGQPTPPPKPLAPGEVDLLALVDPKRDAENGEWDMTPSGLRVKEGGDEKLLMFPYTVPAEYDYEVEFTVASYGTEIAPVLALPHGPIMWKMGMGGRGIPIFTFGPYLDGRDPVFDGKPGPATFERQPLTRAKRYRCVMEVRSGSLRAVLDGNEVFEWKGDLGRLSMEPRFFPRRERSVGLGGFKSSATFHRAVLRPVTAAAQPIPRQKAVAHGEVDLLALVDPRRDAEAGEWEKTAAGLIGKSGAEGLQLIALRELAPAEYDLEFDFTPHDGLRDVGCVLPVGGGALIWKMGFGGGDPTPFLFGPLLDGAKPPHPASALRPKLKAGQRYACRVEVRKNSVRALLDREEVVTWTGDLRRLSIEPLYRPNDPRYLGLNCWRTTTTFHRCILRPVGGDHP